MARPNIVRADTLDLQDQDNPTAAEHQKHPNANGVAPHQALQLNHVAEERHSEEQSLAEAWNITDNLTEEPGAIDQAQANGDHPTTNGTQRDGEEGGENGESEGDGDDDMMDRISSSPSIDDGGYPSSPPFQLLTATRLKVWPARSTSLSPTPPPSGTPTRGGFNGSASSCSSVESSPFVRTPQHLPLLRSVWPEKEASPLSKAVE